MTVNVTLQFTSMDDLWAFRIEALIGYVNMDKDRNILTCRCTAQHVQLAISKYKASIVVRQSTNEAL